MPLTEQVKLQVAEDEEGTALEAFHLAGAGGSLRAIALAISAEDFIDEVARAKHRAIAEIAHPATHVVVGWQPSLRRQHLGGLLGADRPAHRLSIGPDILTSLIPIKVEELPVELQRSGRALLMAVLQGRREALDAEARTFGGGHGLAVARPLVVLGILDDAGTDGVQIDVGGHGEERLPGAVDQDAAEAFLPEGALPRIARVEPLGEALLEELHERGDIEHPRVEGSEVGVEGWFVSRVGGEGVEALADGDRELVAREELEVREDLERGRQGEGIRTLRNLEENVEMVVHDGEGEDADAAEAFTFADEGDEVVLFLGAEDGAFIGDAGNAVIEGAGSVVGKLESAHTHGRRKEEGRRPVNLI